MSMIRQGFRGQNLFTHVKDFGVKKIFGVNYVCLSGCRPRDTVGSDCQTFVVTLVTGSKAE